MYDKDVLWTWLCRPEGMTPAKILKLRSLLKEEGRNSDIAAIYDLPVRQLQRAGLDEETIRCLEQDRSLTETERVIRMWREQGMEVCSCENPLFPAMLRRTDPPVDLLFLKGRTEWLGRLSEWYERKRTVAVVGSRKCTAYGSGAANYLASNLARAGFTIVSGLAGGIDACAHEGALSAAGNTIAVLGCGADICYPRANRSLYREIAGKGLMVTEYFPGSQPLNWHFPLRNRIIAALSSAVVIAEAALDSGSMITVDYALEMDRPVFAVPGSMFSHNSEGTNRLIGQGASIITDWTDISDVLGGVCSEQKEEITFEEDDLTALWAILSLEPQTVDEITEKLPQSASRIMRNLSILELEGLILRMPDGRVMRVKKG